jgi:hypothetical protein
MCELVRGSVLVACVAALATGCGSKAPTCENAADNLIRIEFYGHGRNPSLDEQGLIDQMLPGAKAKLVAWCMKREFSSADLQCVVNARRHTEWVGCGEFNSGYGPPLPEKMPKP